MKKIIIGIGVLVAAGLVFSSIKIPKQTQRMTLQWNCTKLASKHQLHLKGQVQSTKKQTVLVDSEKGPIQAIHVNEGDHVTKDQILVTYRWGEVIRAANDSVVTTLNEDAKNDPRQALMVLKSEESAIKGTVTEYDRSKITLNEPIEIKYANNEKTVKGKFTSLAEMNNEPTKEDTNSLVTYNFRRFLTKRYLLAILLNY